MSSPLRRRRPVGAFTPVGALEGEASFRLLRPKNGRQKLKCSQKSQNGQQKFSSLSQKSTKIALGTGISPEKQNCTSNLAKKSYPPPT